MPKTRFASGTSSREWPSPFSSRDPIEKQGHLDEVRYRQNQVRQGRWRMDSLLPGPAREMARLRAPASNGRYRADTAGNPDRPNGDILELKERGDLGAEEFPYPISHSIWPHPLGARTPVPCRYRLSVPRRKWNHRMELNVCGAYRGLPRLRQKGRSSGSRAWASAGTAVRNRQPPERGADVFHPIEHDTR